MTTQQSMLLAAAIYVALSIAVLYVLYRITRWSVRAVRLWVSGERGLLGADARTRLLGLAATALVFTPLITKLAHAVIRLGVNLFDRVPAEMLRGWRRQAELCGTHARQDCFADTWLVLLQSSGTGVGTSVRDSGILQVQLGLVALAVGLWVVATALLNTLGETGPDGKKRLDLKELATGRSHRVTRQNLLFFLILFIGAYLSLASIAAVPDLRASKDVAPQDVKERLKSSLGEHAVRIDATELPHPLRLVSSVLHPGVPLDEPRRKDATQAPPRTGAGPSAGAAAGSQAGATGAPATRRVFQRPDTAAAAPPRPGAPAPPDTTATDTAASDTAAADTVRAEGSDTTGVRLRLPNAAHVAELRGTFHTMDRLWAERVARHERVQRRVLRQRDRALVLAMAAMSYGDSTSRLREQRSYSPVLRLWYLDASLDLQREYDQSQVALGLLARRLTGWSTAAAAYLASPSSDSVRLEFLRQEAVRIGFDDVVDPEPAVLPRLPERGSQLGVFQWVSGWLLQTDSLPLTLIVGMLGFGLLGAAASTFVREQSARERAEAEAHAGAQRRGAAPPAADGEEREDEPRPPSQPLVLNLPAVVIRGGSAAIVVFLGIMGGLSVFTSEADPNPYALLFTCLVGAVFSEQVWDWAEERFNLSKGGKRNGPPQDEAEPGGNAPGREEGDGGNGGNPANGPNP